MQCRICGELVSALGSAKRRAEQSAEHRPASAPPVLPPRDSAKVSAVSGRVRMRALRRAYLAFAPEFDAVLANYARNAAPAALLDKYRELAAAGDEPSASDSTLLAVAEAGAKLGDAPLAIQVVGRILSEFPDSAHRPQALWTAALVQERAGRRDLMEKTLRRLVVEHGGHPLAHQAAQKLMIPR